MRLQNKTWQNLSVKDQIASLTTTQLCHYTMRTAPDNKINESGFAPIKLYLQKHSWARFGSQGHDLMIHALEYKSRHRIACSLLPTSDARSLAFCLCIVSHQLWSWCRDAASPPETRWFSAMRTAIPKLHAESESHGVPENTHFWAPHRVSDLVIVD